MRRPTRFPHGWDQLPAEIRAAALREFAKLRPLDECDPEKVHRLAVALGLTSRQDGGGAHDTA